MNGVEDQVILDVKTDIPTFIYLFISDNSDMLYHIIFNQSGHYLSE